ncbi:hypothetical protein OsccyDRAFT_1146 [Leptolyngbyaceae cyanobacterium JSC-12]|nr:hypothetical protein OsccyDRAFT_1146 [Leptolyngbyaceae cyanobacterium JSC-12]
MTIPAHSPKYSYVCSNDFKGFIPILNAQPDRRVIAEADNGQQVIELFRIRVVVKALQQGIIRL